MSPLLLHFNKYNLGFHLKTLISKSPRDETLTLVFKMLQEAQETLVTLKREREIKYKKKIQEREREKTSVLLLITSLTQRMNKNE
jgi:hypothetical protein